MADGRTRSALMPSFRRRPDCEGRMPKRTSAKRMARRANCWKQFV